MNEAKHVSPQLLLAVSDAHTASSPQIAAMVRSVQAALKAGTDVKTLAADLLAASLPAGSKVRAVSQATLGYGKAVGTVADGIGVSLDNDVWTDDAIADVYRAAMRAGVKVATKEIPAAGVGGKTPAAKVTRAHKSARSLIAGAKAVRKAATPAPRTSRADMTGDDTSGQTSGQTPTNVPAIAGDKVAANVRAIAGAVASGKVPASPELIKATQALLEALTARSVKVPRPTPSKVASPAAV